MDKSPFIHCYILIKRSRPQNTRTFFLCSLVLYCNIFVIRLVAMRQITFFLDAYNFIVCSYLHYLERGHVRSKYDKHCSHPPLWVCLGNGISIPQPFNDVCRIISLWLSCHEGSKFHDDFWANWSTVGQKELVAVSATEVLPFQEKYYRNSNASDWSSPVQFLLTHKIPDTCSFTFYNSCYQSLWWFHFHMIACMFHTHHKWNVVSLLQSFPQ